MSADFNTTNLLKLNFFFFYNYLNFLYLISNYSLFITNIKRKIKDYV